jgi:hypothetical protein
MFMNLFRPPLYLLKRNIIVAVAITISPAGELQADMAT